MSNNDSSTSNENLINNITGATHLNNQTQDDFEIDSDINNLRIEDEDKESDSNSETCLDNEFLVQNPPENLSEEEMENNYQEALKLKLQGNDQFKEQSYRESAHSYTKALNLCPVKYPKDRSVLFANRAAAKLCLERKESAIEDCTSALELDNTYVKAYLRRAKLYEETSKLDESLADFQKILELDPRQKDALEAQIRLPPKINERNEALKTEMLGKMKDLGNLILRPFGLSTDNFQVNQDPGTGSYSINFKQNTS